MILLSIILTSVWIVDATQGKFFFPLAEQNPAFSHDGSIAWENSATFPNGPQLSVGLVNITGKGTLRIPHWHSDADELTYIVQGQGRVSVIGHGVAETFHVQAGDCFYSPIGYYHYQENIGDEDFVALSTFNSATLVTFDMTQVFGQLRAMNPSILAETFGVSVGVINSLFAQAPNTTKNTFGTAQPGYTVDAKSFTSGPFCFDFSTLRSASASVPYFTGTANFLTAPTYPQLKGLSMAFITLPPNATRELLWFTNADEIGVVITGLVQVGIAGTNSNSQADVHPLDLFWTPSNWVNFIKNVGNVPATLLLVYNNETPLAISLKEAYGGTPVQVLSTMHAVPPSTFAQFQFSHNTPNSPSPLLCNSNSGSNGNSGV